MLFGPVQHFHECRALYVVDSNADSNAMPDSGDETNQVYQQKVSTHVELRC